MTNNRPCDLWRVFAVLLSVVYGLGSLHASNEPAEKAAVYRDINDNAFLRSWLVLGPIPVNEGTPRDLLRRFVGGEPNEAAQEKAFATDFLKPNGGESNIEPNAGAQISVEGAQYQWRLITAPDDVVDLSKLLQNREFAVAYAYAEIFVAEKKSAIFGIGSDDAVKVWLNGKLIHEHWGGRALHVDDDLARVELAPGRNRLLLKVQNARLNWAFVCRPLSKEPLGQRLVQIVATGEVDKVRRAVALGADINARTRLGYTVLQFAKVRGQKEVADFLRSHGADDKAPMPAPETVADRILKDAVKGISPGAAALVAKDGTVVFKGGYGYANLEHRVPITPRTRFRIGSVSKQFTAAAILKLQEQGKLSVDDKLSRFIPDFPRGHEVTIHHLLTHTSGIRSYTSKPDFLSSVRQFTSPESLISSFKNDPFDFEPGKRWSYNNSGYFLLGYIVGKISGKSYADFLKETFFQPLGMTDTGVHHWSDILEHEASGYAFVNGKLQKADNWDMSRAGGAGALYSTIEDLHRWNEAVFSGKVLTETSAKSAFTAVRTAAEDPKVPKVEGYGYGWTISKQRGLEEIAHGGGLHGFHCYLLRIPQQRFTVAVLTNALPPPPGLDATELARTLAVTYLWDKMQARPVYVARTDLSPAVLDAYVGRYNYGVGIMTITRQGNRLFAQLARQPRFEIFPKSETEFFWKVVDAQVMFVKDEKGRVIKAIHRQGGQTIDAPRLP
jgi:CubicO group peptidase (beta-lactamase class C family)